MLRRGIEIYLCALSLLLGQWTVAVAQNADSGGRAMLSAAENFQVGITAFVGGDCSQAIPHLSQAVDNDTSTDNLILVTQVLSTCLASSGDMARARILMQQVLPLIIADSGVDSKPLLDHNLTWAELELSVGERVNAANRITEGLSNYLAGNQAQGPEALRALAAYSAIMAVQNEPHRFKVDIDSLLARDTQVTWTSDQTLADLIGGLPALEGTQESLVRWANAALDATVGVAPFQALLLTINEKP